jgi:hypothetical protein
MPRVDNFLVKFLLASNDSDPGTSKHLIPNKKIGNMSQEFLEKLYKRLNSIVEMNVEDYLRKNENPQDLNNFFKERPSHNRSHNSSSHQEHRHSGDDSGQMKIEDRSIRPENEELMCDEVRRWYNRLLNRKLMKLSPKSPEIPTYTRSLEAR